MIPARDVIWLPGRTVTGREIIAQVAQRRDVTVADITGPSRKRHIAYARQEAMWEMRQRTKLSYPQIAHICGRTNHTTAIHAVKAVEKRLAEAQERAA